MKKMKDKAKTVLLTAFTTFLLTGVATTIFVRYIERPQPKLLVKSINFDLSFNDSVQVPDDIQLLATQLVSVGKLSDFIPYSKLVEVERSVSAYIESIRDDIKDTESWIKTVSSVDQDSIAPTIITEAPILKSKRIRSIFETLLITDAFQGLGDEPVNLDVSNSKVGFYLYENLSGQSIFGIRTATGRVDMFLLEGLTKSQNTALSDVMNSLIMGHGEGLLAIHRQILSEANRQINFSEEFISKLRDLLLQQARLAAIVTVINEGSRSFVLHPSFVLGINHESVKFGPILFDAVSAYIPENAQTLEAMDRYGSLLNRMVGALDPASDISAAGPEQLPPGFIESPDLIPHINISGGASVAVLIRSTSPLQTKGATLKNIYDTGLLKTELVGMTTDGKLVKSNISYFGDVAYDSIRDLILRKQQ